MSLRGVLGSYIGYIITHQSIGGVEEEVRRTMVQSSDSNSLLLFLSPPMLRRPDSDLRIALVGDIHAIQDLHTLLGSLPYQLQNGVVLVQPPPGTLLIRQCHHLDFYIRYYILPEVEVTQPPDLDLFLICLPPSQLSQGIAWVDIVQGWPQKIPVMWVLLPEHQEEEDEVDLWKAACKVKQVPCHILSSDQDAEDVIQSGVLAHYQRTLLQSCPTLPCSVM